MANTLLSPRLSSASWNLALFHHHVDCNRVKSLPWPHHPHIFFSFLNFDSSCSPCATINLCLSKSPWSLQKKKFLAPLKIVHNPIAFKFETTSHLHNTYTKPLLFSRKNGVPLYANCLQEIFWLWFWSLLQREDLRGNIHSANKALEVVAMYIFPNNKWRNNNIFFFCILCFVYTFTFHSWSIELRMIDVTT